ncbi:MAG TPA: hypothetical protein VFW94_24250 [Candidatus Acidoferrales bacterium]|nr:hypothetical protein [Candidatus Acidoferrales bacterium]
MLNIQTISNSELWEKWKLAMDDLCSDPSLANSRKVNNLEEEIFRRMRMASRVDYVTRAAAV